MIPTAAFVPDHATWIPGTGFRVVISTDSQCLIDDAPFEAKYDGRWPGDWTGDRGAPIASLAFPVGSSGVLAAVPVASQPAPVDAPASAATLMTSLLCVYIVRRWSRANLTEDL